MRRIARAFAVMAGAAAAVVLCAALILQTALPDRFLVIDDDGEMSIISRSYLSANIGTIEDGQGEAEVRLLGCVAVKHVSVTVLEEQSVIVSGAPIGIKMFTEGAVIVGMTDVSSEDGLSSPAQDAGLQVGDVIVEADGEKVHGNEQFSASVGMGKSITLKYERNGKTYETVLTPVKSRDGRYRAGVWVRDSAAGIGTLTFYMPSERSFAGLGHAVCDVDTGQLLPIRSGEIVDVVVTGVVQGRAGAPGELTGAFISGNAAGQLKINSETGIYGSMSVVPDGIAAKIAPRQEVHTGHATILATVDGKDAKEYDVYIEKVNLTDKNPTKNMVVRIEDRELLAITGGIVQGMSGCPIMQDGRLIGAVTHVFINDPIRGYGIFAENMLETAQQMFEKKDIDMAS